MSVHDQGVTQRYADNQGGSSPFVTAKLLASLAMGTLGSRLREARIAAGFASGAAAAAGLGIEPATYRHYERDDREPDADTLARIARRFARSTDWLLTGREARRENRRSVPLVGYVGAGAAAVLYGAGQGPFDDVALPDDSSPTTVAVEIRGDSLGNFFNEWLVYYDDVRTPVSTDQIGKLCVVGLSDGRILIKKIQQSRSAGLYHLLSQTEDPILDVEVLWAARVKTMTPK